MEFLRKWMQGLLGVPKEAPTLTEDQLEAINLLSRPAVHIRHGGQGFSRIGGLPDLPAAFDWPQDDGAPLAFLAQIDLSTLPETARDMGFPDSGYLWFFYDQEQSVWGGDSREFAKWRVLYATEAGNARSAPNGLDTVFKAVAIAFEPVNTLPNSSEEPALALELSNAQWETYIELCDERAGGHPVHQLGGWPCPVQDGEMERYCNAGMKTDADDWRLLLQLDTDDAADMMWCDGGVLYFWIREADLRAARFDRVWMLLQSH